MPHGTILENHGLVIHEGKILRVASNAELDKLKGECKNFADLSQDTVLMPGLVNMHSHLAMTALRGLADNVELEEWLKDHIWPAEGKHADADFVATGTAAGLCELIRAGVTTFNDMYFYPEKTARLALTYGVRAAIAVPVFMWPNRYSQNENDCIEKGKALLEEFGQHYPRIVLTMGPHAPYSVSDDGLRSVQAMRDRIPIVHMHVHETAREVVDHAASRDGERPIARLDRLGLLDGKFISVHSVHLTEGEIELLKTRGCSVVHCPESNAKLAAGMAPIVSLMRSGVNVCLGTDGAASNDDYSLLGEMRTAVLLSKLQANLSGVGISAMDALSMATINGARALGLDHLIGSLEEGKLADVIAVRMNLCQPIHNPFNTLAYNSNVKVTHVWVNGNLLLKDDVVVPMDELAAYADIARSGAAVHATDVQQ